MIPDPHWMRMLRVVCPERRKRVRRKHRMGDTAFEVRRMYIEGERSIKELAEILGCTPAAFAKMAARRGWTKKRYPRNDGGDRRAMLYGERLDAVLAEVRSGVSYTQIGARYGVSKHLISKVALRAGIRRYAERAP